MVATFILQDMDRDVNGRVNSIFKRRNWADSSLSVNVYALGESFKRIIRGFDEGAFVRIKTLYDLTRRKHLSFIRIDDLDKDFPSHYKEIEKRDSLIESGDKLNLAFFCADSKSNKFLTMDGNTLKSGRITEYLSSIGKSVVEIDGFP